MKFNCLLQRFLIKLQGITERMIWSKNYCKFRKYSWIMLFE